MQLIQKMNVSEVNKEKRQMMEDLEKDKSHDKWWKIELLNIK